jgi:serine protease Do
VNQHPAAASPAPTQTAGVLSLENQHTEAMSTTKTELSGFSQALTELVERAVQGVVAVRTAPYRVVSGIAVSENLVAVANHSLRREQRVLVRQADGTEGEAAVLGREPHLDVAILKTENLILKPLEHCQPEELKAGALAPVVGFTFDAGPTASLGILGAVGGPRRTWRGGTLDQFLRLDVNLYPSQAGAAVVNTEGQLIGLATPALSRHSTMAVPAATLQKLAQELAQQGRIRQGYIGVGLQPVTIPPAYREKLGNAGETGLIVLTVESGSPAEKAGILLGDILARFGDKPVHDVDDLQAALRGDNVGREVEAVLLRGGEVVSAKITVVERTGRK